MAEAPLRTETRTDYAGTYTAYVYADGHVETDPPGRPLAKEDLQRTRLQDEARKRANAVLQAQRARHGKAGAAPPAIVRENAGAIMPRVLTSPFHGTVDALSTMAATFRAPKGLLLESTDRYALGGIVVGPRAGQRPEFGV